jgi:hypothetical protein
LQKAETSHPKCERFLHAKFEGILRDYKIDPAAYHGGDLTGNACKLLMSNAKEIFAKFLAVLETAVDENTVTSFWSVRIRIRITTKNTGP